MLGALFQPLIDPMCPVDTAPFESRLTHLISVALSD